MMTAAQSVAWNPNHSGFSDDILPFFEQIEHLIPKGGTYVEVGVFLGRSLAFMGSIRPDLHLVAIDAWSEDSLKPSHGDRATYERFMNYMKPYNLNLTVMRGDSAKMLSEINSYVDMVFIDGDHNYPGVKADIIAAKRIVKSGGILSGHDYAETNGVVCAVNELLGVPMLSEYDGVLPGVPAGFGRCWWVRA